MQRYKVQIEYDGTSFVGWQFQRNGLSIQEVLQKAIFTFSKEKVVVTGAGRTDSGVHALAQVAHFDLKKKIKKKSLLPAMASALRSWQNNPDAMYVVGSVAGPSPYPRMVRTWASVIGRIAKQQFKQITGKVPSTLFCVCGGGSNLMSMAYPLLKDKTEIFAVESAGEGIPTGRHGATILGGGKMGILLGFKSKVVMKSAQIAESLTEASGLDFAAVGPEVAYLHDIGRIKFRSTTDMEAKKTFLMCCEKLGIVPAIEACYVINAALKEIKKRKNPRENHLIHLCGSGESNVNRMIKFKRENE